MEAHGMQRPERCELRFGPAQVRWQETEPHAMPAIHSDLFEASQIHGAAAVHATSRSIGGSPSIISRSLAAAYASGARGAGRRARGDRTDARSIPAAILWI